MTKPLALTLLLAPCSSTARGQSVGSIGQLGWLTGSWAAVGGGPGSGEQWMAPAGASMLGEARTAHGGQTRRHEFMQLRDTAEGLVFIALPSGQAEAQLQAEQVGPRCTAFHSPSHDSAQRVIYESLDADTLNARIEGVRNGQVRTLRLPMKRLACPLGAAP